jgi:radical SAM protein with 4Fe4S-binding SPASM domain
MSRYSNIINLEEDVMKKKFVLEIPFMVNKSSKSRLIFFENGLHGSRDHFIRLDLYPLIAPIYKKRHYGWWDIPLKCIEQKSTTLEFDLSSRTIIFENEKGPIKISQGWRGPIEENGYCMLHVSLWNSQKETPHMMSIYSYPIIVFINEGMELPLKQLNIPVTDRCNLKCKMCPRQGTENLAEVDIPDDVLKPLLGMSKDLSCVLLQGLGEPLLYKDIFNVISLLKSEMNENSEVGLTTNGTLLNENTTRKLLNSGLDFLYFSVDAASKATYETIRIGADFGQVIRNIRQCVAYRETSGLGKPRFMMNFVIMQQNLQEIPAFAELAAELGVEQVTFSRCLETQPGSMKILNKNELQGRFDEARKVAERHSININFPPVEKAKEEICFFMERAVVLADGAVVPCHAMAPGYCTEKRSRIFGNVQQKELKDIWNQSDYREFRFRVLSGDFPAECTDCECKAYLIP